MRKFIFHWLDSNVVQEKTLISHDDYLKSKADNNDTEKQIKEKAKVFKEITGSKEWFTDQSPLFEALTTGILNCNGTHRCKTEEVV